jgi:hypothetical protein
MVWNFQNVKIKSLNHTFTLWKILQLDEKKKKKESLKATKGIFRKQWTQVATL